VVDEAVLCPCVGLVLDGLRTQWRADMESISSRHYSLPCHRGLFTRIVRSIRLAGMTRNQGPRERDLANDCSPRSSGQETCSAILSMCTVPPVGWTTECWGPCAVLHAWRYNCTVQYRHSNSPQYDCLLRQFPSTTVRYCTRPAYKGTNYDNLILRNGGVMVY